ncbi:MAG: energy transducer TonB [Betaproteobacteria bacterium]|nr:energy transducer TonB [Betaproteobacteria bacterium]
MAGAWIAAIESRRHRLLGLALLCSVVLHLAVLYVLPLYLERDARPAPRAALSARLAAPQPAPAPPREVEPPRPAAVPAARAKPAARSAPRPLAAPPAGARGLEARTRAPAPAPAAAPAASAPAAGPRGAEPQPAAPAAAPAPRAPDAGSVAQYRLQLMEIARRHKKYPRLAIDNNWEGRVDLRMVIGASGALASLSVRKSAGYAALDEEALAMFRTASSLATIPPALRGTEFTLDLAAEFYFLRQ